MNRRAFLCGGAAAALLAGSAKKYASDRVALGPMKVPLSRMALGTGTHGSCGSSNQARILGVGGMADLLAAGLDQGITFWDSADQYGTHPHLKAGLKRVAREKVTIMSKSHAVTAADARRDIDRFRRELGTDYIDILLLHCMTDADWPQRRKGAMEAIAEAREKGLVRTHGVSCHTLDALRTAARTPWVQVDLARINPAGIAMDAAPATVIGVLREMKAAGKGVIGMKILGVGQLRNRMDEALAHVLSLDCVDCFTIGVESRAQMLDLVRRIPAASVRG